MLENRKASCKAYTLYTLGLFLPVFFSAIAASNMVGGVSGHCGFEYVGEIKGHTYVYEHGWGRVNLYECGWG